MNAGVITLDEIKAGRSSTAGPPELKILSTADAIAADGRTGTSFERTIDAAPAFKPGDAVSTKPFTTQGHTRLPAYARGKPGLIHAHHGAHLLPDAGAKGVEAAEHLYSVVFEAGDLWPEAQGRRDRIFLDLWESYLERA